MITRHELHVMLLEAYEQGLAAGEEKAAAEDERIRNWLQLKERCLERLEKKS